MTLKDDVLLALEKSRDADLSGQMLAEKFGVSRSAVWKAIGVLKDEGYRIDSSTNRGYRLAPDCDRLFAGRIRELLDDKLLPVYAYASVDSTNQEAKRLLAGNNGGSFLVLAEEQTGGRGRNGRAFFSPNGSGLYMTLSSGFDLRYEDALGITAYAAVCVVRAIRALAGVDVGIKWVNDLFLDGRKICGILTEAVSNFESGTVGAILIGIGVNLHPCPVPEPLQGIVGFLNRGGVYKNELAAVITNGLLRYGTDGRDYMEEYRSHSLVLGREIGWVENGVRARGTATGIEDRGGLVVRTEDGRTEVLRSGEISIHQA